MIHQRNEAISLINQLGQAGTPFFFFTDFLGTKSFIEPADERSGKLRFEFNSPKRAQYPGSFSFSKSPISFERYLPVFNRTIEEIQKGNSYLVNLTFKTPIETSLSLEDIYTFSTARYKVLFGDQFVVFSPETFVKIENGYVYTYPMKGTIDARVENAAEKILSDRKEFAEHVTIVDLLRNDLSQIATEIDVTKFRYITKLVTHEKSLLQVSSEIKGKLSEDYRENLGALLFSLLPAGSISGAPKTETVRIIEENEPDRRGFYTGICGHFDGSKLDCGVMIRFIGKQSDGKLFYMSGGGITSFSHAQSEYQEMIDKVYVPIY